ncbi:MAG: hypothetical protein ACOC80_00710 [Petrotogales bacterium]
MWLNENWDWFKYVVLIGAVLAVAGFTFVAGHEVGSFQTCEAGGGTVVDGICVNVLTAFCECNNMPGYFTKVNDPYNWSVE